MDTIRKGLGPQAGDLAGDDGFHDLARAAVDGVIAIGLYPTDGPIRPPDHDGRSSLLFRRFESKRQVEYGLVSTSLFKRP
jgi:hypothetical protein